MNRIGYVNSGMNSMTSGATRSGTEIVFDLEADGFWPNYTRAWCICYKELGVASPVERHGPDHIYTALTHLDKADHLIGHNIINYDLPLLEDLYDWKPRPEVKITDTVVLSRLFKSDRTTPPGCPGNVAPHSLGAWGYRVGRGKPDHDDWSKFTPEMLHRCSEDVEINVLTYDQLLRERDSNPHIDWERSIQIEHEIATIITQQERTGVPMDLARVWKLWNELRHLIRDVDTEVVPLIPEVELPKSQQPTWPSKQYKKNGEPTIQALKYYGPDFGKDREYRTDLIKKTAPINLSSDKQVKEYLMTIGWEPTEWNYKKGKDGKPIRMNGEKIKTSPKLSLESLESCTWPEEHQDMGNKIVDRLMLAHRLSVVKGWLRDVRADGKISALAIPLGTPTGRMTHRQVVNVPGVQKDKDKNILEGIAGRYGYDLRSCFGSLQGYTRVGIDLVSCQIYGLAHYMRDEEYKYQVLYGDHHQFAADLAGLADRQQGKKFNYSILFGASDEKLGVDLGLTKAEAAAARAAYFKGLPKLDALMKRLKKEWQQYGYITGLDGRALWVRAEHMLLVYLLQALESVVIKEFIIGVYNAAKEAGLDYMLVTTMHDECQWLVKDEHVTIFSAICNTTIEQINNKYELWCPQAIDINLGTTWAECH